MKTARALAGCGVLLGATLLAVRADESAPAPASLPAATTPPSAAPAPAAAAPATTAASETVGGISNPTLQTFPIPPETSAMPSPADLATSDPEHIAEQTYLFNLQKQKTDATADLDQTVHQRAYDNDWMMRGYAEQMKKRGLGESKEINSALVSAPIDPNAPRAQGTDPDPLMEEINAGKRPSSHRTSSFLTNSDVLTPKKTLVTGSYQPLLKPFDQQPAPDAAHNSSASFDSALFDLETSSGATLLAVPGTIPPGIGQRNDGGLVDTSESSLLNIPGLTAATQGAIAPNNALTFQDPGENETIDRQHPRTSNNNFMLPTTPTSDISDFFKKQADALRAPTAPNAPVALVAPNHQNLPLTPAPLSRPPASQAGMGMRLHVDDPFDILRR